MFKCDSYDKDQLLKCIYKLFAIKMSRKLSKESSSVNSNRFYQKSLRRYCVQDHDKREYCFNLFACAYLTCL